MKRAKKDFKLVTDTLMVDYNLRANEDSEAEAIIEEIFEVYLQDYLKDFTRKSLPVVGSRSAVICPDAEIASAKSPVLSLRDCA